MKLIKHQESPYPS